MSKILVTGANGQLGTSLQAMTKSFPGFEFLFTDVMELDITQKEQLQNFFTDKRPDFLINCAAYTAVDKAEEEIALARKLNEDACENLAAVCRDFKTTMIHISTDFVFDGQSNQPYSENDASNPLSVYGNTKLQGELKIQSVFEDYLIIRTAWLYADEGHNFVKTILRKGRETGKLKVVYDQIGCPTYAADLAQAIMYIISSGSSHRGVFHYSNEGAISWYDFAQAITDLAAIACEIEAVPSAEFPTPAIRPNYSVLDKSKIKKAFDMDIPYWRTSLKKCIEHINN
jgi:dTDP-4-dehydrorhamnose reductase